MIEPYRVEFDEEALDDLRSIAASVAERSGYLERGMAFAAALRDACLRLAASPHGGTRRPEFGASVRTIGFRRRATIVFEVDDATRTVGIVAIASGGRDRDALIGGRR